MTSGLTRVVAFCVVLQAADLVDPAHLEAAAIAIAASNDSAAIAGLARQLGDRSYLRRLDPPHGSTVSVVHLGRVFDVLAQHPSPAVESLCLALARDADFTAVAARLNLLLNALAAVRPMSEAAANIFRETGRAGYLEVNGPLLAANASPRALEVLGQLLDDESLDVDQRVSTAHWALLPARADAGVVAMCARLLAREGVSHEVAIAILESLFDYRPRPWFGVRAVQPKPPSWKTAPATTRELLRSLGATALTRPDLNAEIRRAIQSTLLELR